MIKDIAKYLKRLSYNFEERVKYYKKIRKYIKNIPKNICVKLNEKKHYLEINKQIILSQQIGTKSVYGIVYRSGGHGINKILYRFATKIMKVKNYNKKEIVLSNILTNAIINKNIPHFPMIYKYFKCKNPYKNTNNDVEVFNNQYYILLIELAFADLKTYLNSKKKHNYNNIKNIIFQLLTSVYCFHKITKNIHNDCHWGNFLYNKIERNGFFYYIIDKKNIYIKTTGYLWMLWDYALSIEIDKNNIQKDLLIKDYSKILNAFIPKEKGGWLPDDIEIEKYDKIVSLLSYIKETNFKDEKELIIEMLDRLYTKKIYLKKPKDENILNINNPFNLDKL